MLSRVHAYLAAATCLAIGYAGLAVFRLSALVCGRSPARARRMLRWCSGPLCRLLQLHVHVAGQPSPTACVYVSNHRSFLDVLVLAHTLEAVFVSRADLARWPMIGRVAKEIGCVFVIREDAQDRIRGARQLLQTAQHAPVVVFPEGTTTGAPLPAPFAAGLFRLLRHGAVPIVPVCIRYSDRRAYWVENLSLWEHLRDRIFAAGPLAVAVHIGAPMDPRAHSSAAAVRDATYAAVSLPLLQDGELCQHRSR